MSNILIHDMHDAKELDASSMAKVHGGIWKRNGVIPGYTAPTVLYDDGINVQTTDPKTSNVGYDSPFTPIPA
ncbi:hypothetical protein ACFQAT_26035 [Undibacterium arcticum]|uniref:Uncharacterized protein n=1 Tax=Undibacterium arcticum TaxID=1762892 RepID=A0ABV7F5K6_9BURK